MGIIFGLDLATFEAAADKVPEGITDQRIEVLHVHDVNELVLEMGFTVAESHGRGDVFLLTYNISESVMKRHDALANLAYSYLNVMQFDFLR